MRFMLWVTGVLTLALVATIIADLREPLGAQEVVLEILPWAPPRPTRKPRDEPLLECVCDVRIN